MDDMEHKGFQLGLGKLNLIVSRTLDGEAWRVGLWDITKMSRVVTTEELLKALRQIEGFIQMDGYKHMEEK